jgi:predicted oxidoreductase
MESSMSTELKRKIIIGCMSWGAWGKQLSQKEQAALIQFCIENGNTTFDHADIYGDYTTEAEFGSALALSGIQRKQVQLITKCGIQHNGKTRNNVVKHYNYTKEYIIWSAERSLRNLKTDYLDTFLLHRPSPLMHPDEIAEAISHLQKGGKIRGFGVSNFTPSQVAMLSDRVEVSVNQIEFSLTQNSAMYDGLLDQMIQKGIQAMSWSPLGTVFKEENEQNNRIYAALDILCDKYNATKDILLLSWILKHPAEVSPVIGTTIPERIKNANRALTLELELEDWFTLLKASQGHEVP